LAGVRLRDTRVSVRGYRGEQGRQHQSNENQKYGAINTGESIHLPLLPPPSIPSRSYGKPHEISIRFKCETPFGRSAGPPKRLCSRDGIHYRFQELRYFSVNQLYDTIVYSSE